MSETNVGIIAVVKVCCGCGIPLKNDTYGMRCEDCFADDVANVPRSRRGLSQAKPLPPELPKTKKKRSIDDYSDE